MYTIYPWMFSICKNNHKLVIVFAYIWSFCQNIKGYEWSDECEEDISKFCAIPVEDSKRCIDALVTIGALRFDKEFGIYYPNI